MKIWMTAAPMIAPDSSRIVTCTAWQALKYLEYWHACRACQSVLLFKESHTLFSALCRALVEGRVPGVAHQEALVADV